MTDVEVLGDPLPGHANDSLEWKLGTFGTILLHVGLAAAYVIGSRITPTHRFLTPQAVSVRLVPLSSIPGARPQPAEAEPTRPVIEKAEEAPAPSPKALPLPEKKPEKKPPPSVHNSEVSPKASRKVSGAPVELPSSGETAGGAGPAGPASNLGTSLSAFDSADFNYSYYVAQMLASIGANWFKPTDQAVNPVLFFRIARDGSISDVRIEKSSGLPFVDRAAQRAILASSPLPPLPADFHESSLGVHLKFE
ncbi:MAG: energy transducer TonB [Thermoanaerobaculia bacterium]